MKNSEFTKETVSIRELVELYAKSKEKKYSRESSWDYCYGIAKCMYARKSELTEWDYDFMALNLGFYLASWGMYRGSAFLLKYSYKIHIMPIKYIFGKDELWGDKALTSSECENLRTELEKLYRHDITETLITKILLGLTGKIIAYDTNCENALKVLGYTGSLSSWDEIYNDALSPSDSVFKSFENEELCKYPTYEYKDGHYVESGKAGYPAIKYLDMFLFEYGVLADAIDKINSGDDNKIKDAKEALSGIDEMIFDNYFLKKRIKGLEDRIRCILRR